MFTNWLTGTSGSSSSSSAANRSHESSQTSNGLSLIGVNGLTNLNPNIISTPPDVVLEVGPAPPTMRFMAHSIVLGMHSGYLRSAIRLDERNSGGVSSAHQQLGADFIVFLSNVTAEQFAPLLSYMYTGYLDLNVENIFGVLLATHVLHMPRALEICRSYLARAQAEGYFGSNNNALSNPLSSAIASSSSHQSALNTSKIIRPIASKPQLNNFGFLPLPHPMASLTSLTTNRTSTMPTATAVGSKVISHDMTSEKDDDDDIDVDELDRQSASNERIVSTIINVASGGMADDDDEDVEVFIDTTSDAEVVVETEIKKLSFKKTLDSKHRNSNIESSASANVKSRHEKSHKKSHRSDKRRKAGAGSSSSSGLQVAKAPIPASQLDTSEANKVIIDVASCDGPVRFKRILNTAYGHKPETCSSTNHLGTGPGIAGQERSLQSVSLSFHQQMAKAISQQQHLHNAEESENSETSNGSAGGGGGGGGSGGGKAGRKIQNEIFVCVYCKHTFKSQYCYQKHAKRHLNPLTLQATCVPPTEKRQLPEESTKATPSSSITEQQTTQIKGPNLQNVRPFLVRNPASTTSQQTATQGCGAMSTPADFLRREVRPLDMNVQYYPCKTCGCKFPSYYFVHKHRKMCHADEEAAQQTTASGTAGGAATSTTSTAVDVSTVAPNDNTDEVSMGNTKTID